MSGIGDFISDLFGGSSSSTASSAVGASDGFNWGQLIKPAIQAGYGIYSGISEQKQQEKAQAAADDFAREKFEADMQLAREKMAMGGGGGGDPYAAEKMRLARRQQRLAELDSRLNNMNAGQQLESAAFRSLGQLYQNSYE